MNCQENERCCKQLGKCVLFGFLAILGIAIVLKVIALILCIVPGSDDGNTWLVMLATFIVILSAICCKKGRGGCCNRSCDANNCCAKGDEDSKTSEEA